MLIKTLLERRKWAVVFSFCQENLSDVSHSNIFVFLFDEKGIVMKTCLLIVFIKLQSRVPLRNGPEWRTMHFVPCCLVIFSGTRSLSTVFLSAKMKMIKLFMMVRMWCSFYMGLWLFGAYVLSDNQSFKFNQNVYRNSIKFFRIIKKNLG